MTSLLESAMTSNTSEDLRKIAGTCNDNELTDFGRDDVYLEILSITSVFNCAQEAYIGIRLHGCIHCEQNPINFHHKSCYVLKILASPLDNVVLSFSD
jgi:hypothetical protein